LSASASPASGPCGMPLELEPADVDGEFVVAAAPDGLEDWAGGFAADVDELEEPEPQAATPNAANSSRTAAKQRGGLLLVEFVRLLLCPVSENRGWPVAIR